MSQPIARLTAVFAGRPRPFARGRDSAIAKRQLEGPVAVGLEGLGEDRQADTKVHGGPDRALLHYASEHYAHWRQTLPTTDPDHWRPAAFGENLAATGLTEAEVCIGDRLRIGDVLLEVSQPRSPCWKIEQHSGVADLVERVRRSARSGWFYRIIEPGALRAGDAIETLERPHPDWPLARLWTLRQAEQPDPGELAEAAALPPLSPHWRDKYRRRLAAG